MLASLALARTFATNAPPTNAPTQGPPRISAGPPVTEPPTSQNTNAAPTNAADAANTGASASATDTPGSTAEPEPPATEDPPAATAAQSANASPEYLTRVRAGRYALDRRLLPRARTEFRRALEVKPDGVEAQIGLAWVALRIGYYPVAARSFRRLYSQGHNTAEVRAGLGLSHAKLREREPALRYLRAYLASNPQGPFAQEARRALTELGAG